MAFLTLRWYACFYYLKYKKKQKSVAFPMRKLITMAPRSSVASRHSSHQRKFIFPYMTCMNKVFPDMPCMKRVYMDKQATVHLAAAQRFPLIRRSSTGYRVSRFG